MELDRRALLSWGLVSAGGLLVSGPASAAPLFEGPTRVTHRLRLHIEPGSMAGVEHAALEILGAGGRFLAWAADLRGVPSVGRALSIPVPVTRRLRLLVSAQSRGVQRSALLELPPRRLDAAIALDGSRPEWRRVRLDELGPSDEWPALVLHVDADRDTPDHGGSRADFV